MYDNEREVGEGVRASGQRNEVMVTTKVQPSLLAPHDLERSVKESLAKLRLDDNRSAADPLAEPARAAGGNARRHGQDETRGLHARRSGCRTSRWPCSTKPTSCSSEPLVCNQVECHPYLDQDKVIAACRKYGMAVVAYSPIARGQAKGDKLLARIGQAHGKSAAQVCLRWLTQQGIVVIPRTSKPERLAENFAILDFELSDAEMKEIAGLAHRGGRIVDWTWSPKWD